MFTLRLCEAGAASLKSRVRVEAVTESNFCGMMLFIDSFRFLG